jgi:sugar lactone lactonase YvrE
LTVDAQGRVWVPGGEHLDRLIITTSRQDLAADAEPLAGAVFSYLAGVPDARCFPYLG